MNAQACVTTAKGTAAIASIHLEGSDANSVMSSIFRSIAAGALLFESGGLYVGDIFDGEGVVDHVVVACHDREDFEITCHGNYLIVEAIMKLLVAAGVELVTVEDAVKERIAGTAADAIVAEARLVQLKSASIEGVRLIEKQIEAGLGPTVRGWLSESDSIDVDRISSESKEIMARGKTAGLIINGCRAVIAGAPNSGKSTLLNCLAGVQKAIVTDVAGTTRDWVTATCRVGPLLVTFADTAGADEGLTQAGGVDAEAQRQTGQLLADCDVVLRVVDGSVSRAMQAIDRGKPVLTVVNKCDLDCVLDEDSLAEYWPFVKISAKTGDGLEELAEGILNVLGVNSLNISAAISFTARQDRLLTQLAAGGGKRGVKSLITELLSGYHCV